MPDVQARLDALSAQLGALKSKLDPVRAQLAQSPVAADLQAISDAIDQLVTDVKAAVAEYRDPQP